MDGDAGGSPFCGACIDATILVPAPSTMTVNGIGTALYGRGDPCGTCGSVVKRLWFCVFYVPVVPLMSRYRVIRGRGSWQGPTYVGRKIPDSPDDRLFVRKPPPVKARATPRPTSALPDHPELITPEYEKAQGYLEAGRVRAALPLLEEALAEHERVLGVGDPATLRLRGRLGGAYLGIDRLDEAIPLLDQTGLHMVRVLGADDPDTQAVYTQLFATRLIMGKVRKERRLHTATLRRLEQSLGADHPKTLRTGFSLARCLRSDECFPEAIELLETTLAAGERTLGPDHPDTRLIRDEILQTCTEAEEYDAPALLEAATAARERLLGADHIDTLYSRHRLAGVYRLKWRRAKATALWQRTLEDCRRTLRSDHPLTRDIERNLR